MRIQLVTGGRKLGNTVARATVLTKLLSCPTPDVVIHGAYGWDASNLEEHSTSTLSGVDAVADEWALRVGAQVWRIPALWVRGRKAETERDGAMVDMLVAMRRVGHDIAPPLAFLGGAGTWSCIACCQRFGFEPLVHSWGQGGWTVRA